MEKRDEARARFEALAKGRYAPRRRSVQESKESLRQLDPGLDVSRVLQALDTGDLNGAAKSLTIEMVASQALVYFYPLIVTAIETVTDLILKKPVSK